MAVNQEFSSQLLLVSVGCAGCVGVGWVDECIRQSVSVDLQINSSARQTERSECRVAGL